MSKTTTPMPPVAPIGRIPWSHYVMGWSQQFNPKYKGQKPPNPVYDRVCKCKGYSSDAPFMVLFHKFASDKEDNKPYKVVYYWRHPNPTKFKFSWNGEAREEYDDDSHHMLEIIDEHATKSAAQQSMRKFASEAFEKVNRPPKYGEACHNVAQGNKTIFVGDIVYYAGCPGVVWKIVGERRYKARWFLQLQPALSFLNIHLGKKKELHPSDVENHTRLVDIVELGTFYTELGLFVADEARRKSQ